MKVSLIGVLCAGVAAFACSDSSRNPTSPETFSLPVQVSSSTSDQSHASTLHTGGELHNFGTHLSGDEEVPVRDTSAQGQANFKVQNDGTEISYKLIVANIENVTQSHIHLGPPGVAGGIVVWLYPSAPPLRLIPGRSDGPLAEGVITRASLVGALAGQPLSALVNAIKAGNAYVNVHTSQFPPGEIRGQID
jgi:hypothetical protein